MPHTAPQPRDEYSELRAQIWRLAADPMLDEAQVIQQVLDLVGPSLDVSRACFNRQHVTLFSCELEWCAPGVRSSIGSSMPIFLARHFLSANYAEITLDNAVNYVPALLRPVAWPIIRGMAMALNLKAVYMVSYYAETKSKVALPLMYATTRIAKNPGQTRKNSWSMRPRRSWRASPAASAPR